MRFWSLFASSHHAHLIILIADVFNWQARKLAEEGRLKEAERLYVTVKEPDMAIAMYKRAKQYDNMIRLVKQFHADLLQDTYIHVAKEIESEGKHKQAEHYYIEGEC